MTPPTVKDADLEHGTVLINRGVWGWVNCPWQQVKPSDEWKRGYLRERVEPRPEPQRAAWI